jgi:hypothetical protein
MKMNNYVHLCFGRIRSKLVSAGWPSTETSPWIAPARCQQTVGAWGGKKYAGRANPAGRY